MKKKIKDFFDDLPYSLLDPIGYISSFVSSIITFFNLSIERTFMGTAIRFIIIIIPVALFASWMVICVLPAHGAMIPASEQGT